MKKCIVTNFKIYQLSATKNLSDLFLKNLFKVTIKNYEVANC